MKRLSLYSFLALVLFLFLFVVYSFLPTAPKEKTLEIPYGTPTAGISQLLYREGVIRTPLSFLMVHVFLKKKLEAGEYEFDGLVYPWDVYLKIARGEKKLYRITVPEGYDVYDIARLLEEHQICSREDFLKYATSPEIAKKYGLNTYTVEGFLFPDTYFFSKNTHPLRVIDVMHKNFLKKTQHLREELKNKGLSLEMWVTVASMVEKETALKHEKPLVSAVIYNRMKRGMKLDIDPTVIYAMKIAGTWKGVLTKKDLQMDSPYNTYRYPGLPPSPICNPGLDSLEAALNPARVDYLFFVADGSGGHRFSDNYTGHLQNIRLRKAQR